MAFLACLWEVLGSNPHRITMLCRSTHLVLQKSLSIEVSLTPMIIGELVGLGEQDGGVVNMPAYRSKGSRFDPWQYLYVQLSLWWFKQSHTNS